MAYFIRTISLLCLLLTTSRASAAVTPLAVAIIPPVQFPPSDFNVAGARVSAFWGKHRNVYGFDIGLIGNMTEQHIGGLQLSGLFNMNRGMATIVGLQFAGAVNVNVNKARIVGVQLTGGINSNVAESSLVGLQLAPLANLSGHTKIFGAQVGLYNKARTVYGFQIGLINVTDSLHGLQIGLLNHHAQGLFTVSPIINFGF